MKSCIVSVTIPSLPAAHAQQTTTSTGRDIPICVQQALKEIFSRKAVKRKRISSFRILVEVSEKGEDN